MFHCYLVYACQVDEYPPLIHEWTTLDDSADTKLDNPSKIYFGRNSKYSCLSLHARL